MQSKSFSKKEYFLPEISSCNVCVIGLGYVGLPLTIEISSTDLNSPDKISKRKVIGFDINEKRIEELLNNFDRTREIKSEILEKTKSIIFTSDPSLICTAEVFIVTTPTPIDDSKKPDLNSLINACKTIGNSLKKRLAFAKSRKILKTPIIIFESTVFPGATEEICVPIIEKFSSMNFHGDNPLNSFVCGYSPERINPGDDNRKLGNIKKVVSGSSYEVGKWVNSFYKSFISAGTYLAPSLKVAEAAKVIENTQRDLNIAFMNELSILFNKLEIDTFEVLKAAETKWNFIPFRPGLVGGHCIGVDPYYLTYKAEQLGYHPQVVLAGRRINDYMPQWIAEQMVLHFVKKGNLVKGSRLLILGMTFKENCPDIRNSRVFDLIKILTNYGFEIEIVDPYIENQITIMNKSFEVKKSINDCGSYDAAILAVAHRVFFDIREDKWKSLVSNNGVIFDVKGIVPKFVNPITL